MKVSTLATGAGLSYSAFLKSVPNAMIYHSLEFLDFVSLAVAGEAEILICEREGQITGALPLLTFRHPIGDVINSLPWYGSHGGCVMKDADDQEVRGSLLEEYGRRVIDPKILAATLILSPSENSHVKFYEKALAPRFLEPRVGQITELPEAGPAIGEDIMGNLKQKTRNLVRKSLKQGLDRVITDEDWAWEFLHHTHKENIEGQGGQAKPWEHFKALRDKIPSSARSLTVAVLNGKPVAGLLLFFFQRTVEYITPVVRAEQRPIQPLSFLIYHAMVDAVKRGFRRWNWGGTWASQESLHHFKAGWGGHDHSYTYMIHATDRAIDMAKNDLAGFCATFPFYYLLPFASLSDVSEDQ